MAWGNNASNGTNNVTSNVTQFSELELLLNAFLKTFSGTEEFVLWTFILCVVTLYFLLYSSYIHALFWRIVVNWFVIGRGTRFHVNSVRVALLSGKILFKDVQFTTSDMSVKSHMFIVKFAWWLRDVRRRPTKNQRNLPFRLTCKAQGLEIVLYNKVSQF